MAPLAEGVWVLQTPDVWYNGRMNEARDQAMIEMRLRSVSVRQIAERFGVSHQRVSQRLIRLGVAKPAAIPKPPKPRRMRPSVEERFWSRVIRTDRCWLWTGAHLPTGYGTINVDGRHRYSHRVSWELHNGPIPVGLWVLHRCDNPPCVRPDHLWLGTARDNARDRDAKGRDRFSRYRVILANKCGRGHTFTPENTGHKGNGGRYCRECNRAAGVAYGPRRKKRVRNRTR